MQKKNLNVIKEYNKNIFSSYNNKIIIYLLQNFMDTFSIFSTVKPNTVGLYQLSHVIDELFSKT